jgi:hypothetical protein
VLPEKLFDARTVLIRALKVKHQHYGMDHAETARLLDNIAAAMYLQGRHQSALDVYAQALECKIRTVYIVPICTFGTPFSSSFLSPKNSLSIVFCCDF